MSYPAYPEYKDSGVEWLGEVPVHWMVAPFKWQLDSNDGGVWGENPAGENDTFVLRSTDQSVDGNWRISDPALRALSARDKRSATLKKGDLVVTKSSGSSLHIGKTTLVSEEIEDMNCCFGNFMQRLRTTSSLQPKLAWYIMNNGIARLQLDLLSNSTTGLANLNGTIIGEIILSIPPVDEQATITTFLDYETARIDALVEEQQRLIALLKEKRQAVISHAVTKGLDPDVPMKDSGVEWLGEVPEHWEVKRIKHVVRIFEQGWSPQCENVPVQTADEWGVLKVGCVNNGVFRSSENKKLPQELQPNPALTVRTGDILISRANTRELVGSCAVPTVDVPNLMISDKLFRLRLKKNSAHPRFIAFFMGTAEARNLIEIEATGASSSMLNIGQRTILEMEFPCPPLDEQTKIQDQVINQTWQLLDLAGQAIELKNRLEERRSALISAAVTGKIDVRDWQPPLELLESRETADEV